MTAARPGGHYVYIVECSKGTYYTGYTNDLENRIKQHNEGKGAKYLRGRAPVKVVYSRKHRTLGDALRAESRIKGLTRAQKEKLVKGIITWRKVSRLP
jgi:putative endonuclease